MTPGKAIEGETVADGSGVARRAGNAAGAKGPYCSCSSSSKGGRGALIKAPINLPDHAAEDLRPGEGRVGWMRWSRRGALGVLAESAPSR